MFGENREAWAAAGVCTSMVLACAAPAGSVVIPCFAWLLAWACLFALCIPRRADPRLLAVLLLVPIHAGVSLAAPETRAGKDTWFDTDDWLYREILADGAIAPRHVGLDPFFGAFPLLERLATRGAVPSGTGEAVVRAGSAVASALATAAAIVAVRPSGGGAAGVLAIVAASLTLGRWTNAAVIESGMYSLALSAAALRLALGGGRAAPARPFVVGLVAGSALAVSLDNVHLLVPLVALAFLRQDRAVAGRVADAATISGFASAIFLVVASVAFLSGRPVSDIPAGVELGSGSLREMWTHLGEFASLYLHPEFLVRPAEILASGFRVFVMAVVAQPGNPADVYSHDPRAWMLLTPGTILLVVLGASAAAAYGRGVGVRIRELRTAAGAATVALLALVAARFAWHVVFAPRDVLLFTPKIHLAAAMTVALAAGASSPRERRVLATAFAAIVVLLLVANGAFLVGLP